MSILQLLKEATRLINKVELTNDNKNRLKDIAIYPNGEIIIRQNLYNIRNWNLYYIMRAEN